MIKEIKMPNLGTTTSEIRIVRWLKKENDAVKRGEALFEVETDKATLEVESYLAGLSEEESSPVSRSRLRSARSWHTSATRRMCLISRRQQEAEDRRSRIARRRRRKRQAPCAYLRWYARSRRRWAWITQRYRAPAPAA